MRGCADAFADVQMRGWVDVQMLCDVQICR